MISVLGDLHIPNRATEIPERFCSLLRESELILCTGDLVTQEVLDELQGYGRLVAVRGNMDGVPLPEQEVVDLGLKLGLFHGTGVSPRGNPIRLAEIAKGMGVGALISGHTHSYSIQENNGILLLNPGSATGAWGGSSGGADPTMMTIRLEGKKIYIQREELTSTGGESVYELK